MDLKGKVMNVREGLKRVYILIVIVFETYWIWNVLSLGPRDYPVHRTWERAITDAAIQSGLILLLAVVAWLTVWWLARWVLKGFSNSN